MKQFFKNQNINPVNFKFSNKLPEPCDVYCKNTKQQFQITNSEHQFQKDIRVNKYYDRTRKLDKAINDIITDPIIKKINRYKQPAKNIILLIQDHHNNLPSVCDKYIEKTKMEIKKNNNNYFLKIYLVCQEKNIEIY